MRRTSPWQWQLQQNSAPGHQTRGRQSGVQWLWRPPARPARAAHTAAAACWCRALQGGRLPLRRCPPPLPPRPPPPPPPPLRASGPPGRAPAMHGHARGADARLAVAHDRRSGEAFKDVTPGLPAYLSRLSGMPGVITSRCSRLKSPLYPAKVTSGTPSRCGDGLQYGWQGRPCCFVLAAL